MAAADVEKVLQEAEQCLVNCRALSQRAATYCNRIVGESDALAVEIKSLLQTITICEKDAKAVRDKEYAELLNSMLKDARAFLTGLGPGGDLRKFCKPKNPWLVRLLLGDKINLVALRRDVSQGIREEYHSFRDNAAGVMLLGPLCLLAAMWWGDRAQGAAFGRGALTPVLLTGVQMYLVWLSYFYMAMALRENVLVVNGSRIRSWWIEHHYCSAAASLLLLGLPIVSPAVHQFVRGFLFWSVFQGLVMFVQNRYQRRRMYTRIALGRNTSMDVVAGESSGGSGQLFLLYPMLFTLQLSQFAIGAAVAWRTWPAMLNPEGWWLESEPANSDLRGMRGVFFVGLIFAYLAWRNFITTLLTLLEKRRSSGGSRSGGGRSSNGVSRSNSLTSARSKGAVSMRGMGGLSMRGSLALQRSGAGGASARLGGAGSGGAGAGGAGAAAGGEGAAAAAGPPGGGLPRSGSRGAEGKGQGARGAGADGKGKAQ